MFHCLLFVVRILGVQPFTNFVQIVGVLGEEMSHFCTAPCFSLFAISARRCYFHKLHILVQKFDTCYFTGSSLAERLLMNKINLSSFLSRLYSLVFLRVFLINTYFVRIIYIRAWVNRDILLTAVTWATRLEWCQTNYHPLVGAARLYTTPLVPNLLPLLMHSACEISSRPQKTTTACFSTRLSISLSLPNKAVIYHYLFATRVLDGVLHNSFFSPADYSNSWRRLPACCRGCRPSPEFDFFHSPRLSRVFSHSSA